MFQTLYIEEAINNHPRTQEIRARFPKARVIPCHRYGEVFNRKAQNFRLQKRAPALILAEKFDHFVLEAPRAYAIGGERNYYFSHTLNCIYDCRYCFLQGMFESAHHVLFVNYERFQEEIASKIEAASGEAVYFFSGYDCDSLALDGVTRFTDSFLPFFAQFPNAWLELRTKSVQIQTLLKREPISNCIVAFSFTPQEIQAALEHKTPAVQHRIRAMESLQNRGWKLGLRFDPLIYHVDYLNQYRRLFEEVFRCVRATSLHSVSLGPFRLPRPIYQKIVRLYPDEKVFAGPLAENGRSISYRREIEEEMTERCQEELLRYIPSEIYFRCEIPVGAGT